MVENSEMMSSFGTAAVLFLSKLTKPADRYGCASHVAVETPVVKSTLSSKCMVGKAALYFKNHFKNWSNSYGCFQSKAHQEALMRQCFLQ